MRNLTHTLLLGTTFALGVAIVPASAAEQRSASDVQGQAEAVRSAGEAQRGDLSGQLIIEGRNIAAPVPSTNGVEPYIARTIELDARSNR